MAWTSEFRARMTRFESLRAPRAGEFPISIKIRVASGCFHREHSPHAYRVIDAALAQVDLEADRLDIEEHESGPEILAYVALTAAGIGIAKSIIDLVVAILKARSESVRKGDHPSAPLDVVVRRFDDRGQVREEIALRIGHTDAVRRPDVEERLREALGKLAGNDTQGPRPADKRQPKAPSRRKRPG